jgi:serine/threonine protein phosphatase PrpC
MPRSSTHSTHSKGEAIVQAALDRLEVGVHRDRGGLEVMEDEHSVVQRTSALALVGVYDGHCGREAAAYLRDHLLQSVEALLDEYSSKGADSCPLDSSSSSTRDEVAARHALISGFGMCEDALSAARTTAGATAVVLMLQSGGRALNVAWCGDCRAVLSRGGAAVVLTTDHTCQNEHERTRVRRVGLWFSS